MKIESIDVIEHPRELVFATLRDELPALVPYLPNVEEIQVRSRRALDDGRVEVLNWWKAKSDVPRIARALVTPDMLHWLDHATWNEADWSCEWRIETSFFRDQIACSGRNGYVSLGPRRTELAVRGDLAIDARTIKGVPKLMAGAVGAAIEAFVVASITPNFSRLTAGLVRYLDEIEGKSP